jgi:hypothetical protein
MDKFNQYRAIKNLLLKYGFNFKMHKDYEKFINELIEILDL